MHAGRIAHPDNKDGHETIAPSPLAAPNEMFTAEGPKPHPVPRALDTDEIPGVVADFVHAAKSAIEAGLDGVEIHAANGYLLHQFLDPTINLREDDHGGSPANRARFVIEVVTAVAEAIGAEKVGLRISPGHQFNGVAEELGDDLTATYTALVDGVAPLGLAYLSLLSFSDDPELAALIADLRTRFGGSILFNTGFGDVTSRASVEDLLEQGLGDAIVVGRPFLANPDLRTRWEQGAALNEPDADTFYGGGAEGYTDYPTLEAS